jgi:transcription termination factor NusB
VTHDELLVKIDSMEMRYKNEEPRRNALRAIVELVKTYKDEEFVNSEFNHGLHAAFWLVIQAIEKELG